MALLTPPSSFSSQRNRISEIIDPIQIPDDRSHSRGRRRTRKQLPPLDVQLAHKVPIPQRPTVLRPFMPVPSPTHTNCQDEDEMIFPMSPLKFDDPKENVGVDSIWRGSERCSTRGRTKTRGRVRCTRPLGPAFCTSPRLQTVYTANVPAVSIPEPTKRLNFGQTRNSDPFDGGIYARTRDPSPTSSSQRSGLSPSSPDTPAEDEEPFMYSFPVFQTSAMEKAKLWRANRQARSGRPQVPTDLRGPNPTRKQVDYPRMVQSHRFPNDGNDTDGENESPNPKGFAKHGRGRGLLLSRSLLSSFPILTTKTVEPQQKASLTPSSHHVSSSDDGMDFSDAFDYEASYHTHQHPGGLHANEGENRRHQETTRGRRRAPAPLTSFGWNRRRASPDTGYNACEQRGDRTGAILPLEGISLGIGGLGLHSGGQPFRT